MGLDLDQLFGDAWKAAEQGMNDVLKTGGNAALGYLEDQAIAIIAADRDQHLKEAQDHTKEILSRPTAEGSFGEYLKSMIQSPTLQTFGAPMLMMFVAVGVGGYFLLRKG